MADDYQAAVETGEGAYYWIIERCVVPLRLRDVCLAAILEKHAVLQSPSQIESLVRIFVHATKVCGFYHLTPPADRLLIVGIDGDGFLGHGQ